MKAVSREGMERDQAEKVKRLNQAYDLIRRLRLHCPVDEEELLTEVHDFISYMERDT